MNQKSLSTIFSSKTDLWATPHTTSDALDKEFKFTLDPCSTDENTKCKDHFTAKDDGLARHWSGRVFMNPPYGREIGKRVAKAHEEVLHGCASVAVCLLPARTDTSWWHDHAMKGEIRFVAD